MNTRNQKTSGFTLIEALVAIAILLLAITAPFLGAFMGLTDTGVSRDRTLASFLAQDAAEYILTYKKQKALNGQPWLSGAESCINNACQIDTSADKIQSCGSGNCGPIEINTTTGEYGYGGGPSWKDTKFVRTVNIQMINDHEALVTISINWNSSQGANAVAVKMNIFDIPPA